MEKKTGSLKYEVNGNNLVLFMKKDKPKQIEVVVEEQDIVYTYTLYSIDKIREKRESKIEDRNKKIREILKEVCLNKQNETIENALEELKKRGIVISRATFFRQNFNLYVENLKIGIDTEIEFQNFFNKYCIGNHIRSEKEKEDLLSDIKTYCDRNNYKEYIEYLIFIKSHQ